MEETSILVVDDDATTARWVACLASRTGFNALVASDAGEALNRLTEERFAAVISDVEMPGMNGLELLQHIRLHFPELPVILMTAFCDEARLEAARALGALALLEKPVRSDHLAFLFGTGAEADRKLSVKGLHLFSGPATETSRPGQPTSRAHPPPSIYEPGEPAPAAQ